MPESKPKRSFIQLVKFVLVGASNTLVDLIVTRIIMALTGWDYVAKVIGYILGIINSYVLNSAWTFKRERKRNTAEMLKFLAVNIAVLGISLGLKWLFQSGLQLDVWWIGFMGENWFTGLINGEYFCTLLATVICIFINFIGNKLFVFRPKSEEGEGEDVS